MTKETSDLFDYNPTRPSRPVNTIEFAGRFLFAQKSPLSSTKIDGLKSIIPIDSRLSKWFVTSSWVTGAGRAQNATNFRLPADSDSEIQVKLEIPPANPQADAYKVRCHGDPTVTVWQYSTCACSKHVDRPCRTCTRPAGTGNHAMWR